MALAKNKTLFDNLSIIDYMDMSRLIIIKLTSLAKTKKYTKYL